MYGLVAMLFCSLVAADSQVVVGVASSVDLAIGRSSQLTEKTGGRAMLARAVALRFEFKVSLT